MSLLCREMKLTLEARHMKGQNDPDLLHILDLVQLTKAPIIIFYDDVFISDAIFSSETQSTLDTQEHMMACTAARASWPAPATGSNQAF